MIRPFLKIAIGALAVALTLSACGGGAQAPTGKTIEVETTEFAFTPNTFTAKVGEAITFEVTNKGTLDHNFVVFDPAGAEVARGTVALGGTANIKVTPSEAGTYEVVCDVAGHKESGMTGVLTVSP
jgi:plastocyanin